ncbi:MAG TPA: response regulator [Candidatus Hydrogenedentes bacterium]|nr:response regulator [Candidatus Hydrogenedentota bacterium]
MSNGITGKDASELMWTVVVAEDEPSVRQMLLMMLSRMGFNTLTADTPEACLNLALSLDRLDLLVTDVVMPRMNGVQLFEAVRHRHPAVRTLFISGHTDDSIHPEALLSDRTAFLSKPFNKRSLETAIFRLMDSVNGNPKC